jgi:Holliday junction resolvase-like predicted endonuclease
MILAAQLFLHEKKLHERDARFDVVGISWPGTVPLVEHVKNAFVVAW